MESSSICPIDLHRAEQVSALLKPPSPHQVKEYFDKLIRTRQCNGLVVKQDGEFGKGVYADLDFGEGELVLKDQILVGAQHSSNKIDCLVCSFCFKFVGSIELQIGRKLYLQDLGGSANHECEKDYKKSEECSSSHSRDKIPLPEKVVESLMNKKLVLPHSKRFSLPLAMSCPGGCQEAYYCSQLCADADWELFHSLLCTGGRSQALCQEALINFVQHANETNDIFLLAAKGVYADLFSSSGLTMGPSWSLEGVISFTILKYRKIKAAYLKEPGNCTTPDAIQNHDLSLLLEAWKPISMGYKRRWWDCIALPDDVDPCDEAAFRMQIRELAFTSLQLLKEAIFDEECEPLFSLEIYGNIIGMFELNNLNLVVASPVEDYFLYIDDLPYPEKEEAEEITQPILDALGEDYSVCCQGTAFFPLQSCMNHSCRPNAKAFKREEDRDGQATIIALRPICKGEEVTISYIDEDLPFDVRQALLADYGFRCRCSKCSEEDPR